jgi:chaperonin GroES
MTKLPEGTNLKDLIDVDNIADMLDEDCLNTIGAQVVTDYEADEQSRAPWVKRYESALKLAMQVKEDKTFPWRGAANVKFPAMTLAAITFHARAYPSLVPSKELVNVKTVGRDFLGMKKRRAERIKIHMNYQFLDQMEEWDEEMDRLLITLPITGTEFKKVYYSEDLGRNVSRHVFAKDLVVNYYTTSLAKSSCITEILPPMSMNEIKEMINMGLYRECDFSNAVPRDDKITKTSDKIQGLEKPPQNDNTPRVILEQHTWYDLDGDGYKEPYICTVDKDTRKVLRIVARFQAENIKKANGTIAKIIPDNYYVKYSFIPSPDGGFYDIGFGHLIGPLNEAVNTILNQLIDAGTQASVNSGFIAKSFRPKGGNMEFQLGEWKFVNATMQDMRNGILPLPSKEPSSVLFQLLGMLIEVTQKVTSTTDMMVGENPGQNQKATTTMQVVENGMRVFTAIYKRLRRSLSHEIVRVYDLNRLYLDDVEYFTVVDPDTQDQEQLKAMQSDYEDKSIDVLPTADPNAVSQYQKAAQADFLLKMIALGAPAREVLKRAYEAFEIDNFEPLLPPEQTQQPPIEMMLKDREISVNEENNKEKNAIAAREVQRKELETLANIRQGDEKLDLDHLDSHKASALKAVEIGSRHAIEEKKVDAKANSGGSE